VRPLNRRARPGAGVRVTIRACSAGSLMRLGALALFVALVAGCSPSTSPAPSPGSAAGCATDVRGAGTFPDLEALLPRGMIEAAPTTVDSGANCTDRSLGSYREHGIGEVRFAGATWDYGNGNATVAAVFATPAGQPRLDATWVEEFYLAGAFAARGADNLDTSRPTVPGVGVVFRLDTLNNLSQQTVVVWPDDGFVHVVIVATDVGPDASRADHDERVRVAIEVADAAAP
jgi:hypothetical protein